MLAGLPGGRRFGMGTLIYRVYVANDPGDPKGSVPLPSVAIREQSGRLVPLAPAGPARQRRLIAVLGLLARVITRRAKLGDGMATDSADVPQFRLPPSLGGLLANPDNAYLAAPITWAPGRVVIVRGKAPVFPNTRAGMPATTPVQLRYWSLSVGELRNPYPVVQGTPDFEVALDADGYYTFAVSTATDRPRNATPADAVTWLPWGDTRVPNVLILRNMLPSPDFHQAVQAIPAGATANEIRTIMGPYYPVAAYCDKSQFEAIGAHGCLDAALAVRPGST